MLIVHLFFGYAHVNLCHFFPFSWCRGLAAASACGSSWTFLFTFFSNGIGSVLLSLKEDGKALGYFEFIR